MRDGGTASKSPACVSDHPFGVEGVRPTADLGGTSITSPSTSRSTWLPAQPKEASATASRHPAPHRDGRAR